MSTRACHQLTKPDGNRSQVNRSQEVTSGLVVASSNASILLELLKEVLNQMSPLVHLSVVLSRLLTATLWRNDRLASGSCDRLQHSRLGIVGFISDESVYLIESVEQNIGSLQVMSLTGGQVKARWIAQRIAGGVNFAGESASTATDGLSLSGLIGTFFSRPHYPDAPGRLWHQWQRTRYRHLGRERQRLALRSSFGFCQQD